MSFTRVGPGGGWSVGAVLTSTQINNLDINVSKSLDKSVAGDTLSGSVVMAGTAALLANNSGNIIAAAAGAITTTAPGAISAGGAGGITDGGHAGGIAATVAGGISDGAVAHGIEATVAGGIASTVAGGITSTILGGIRPGVAGGIQSNFAAGFQVTIANGLQTTAVGGITLNGGTGDNIVYANTRTQTLTQFLAPMPGAPTTGWSFVAGATAVFANSTANSGGILLIELQKLVDGKVNGATLTSATLSLGVSPAHNVAGAAPATMPGLYISRCTTQGAVSSLFSSSPSLIATPASNVIWYNAGAAQTFTFTPNQNNVIDCSTYSYSAAIVDEQGAGSFVSNIYYTLQLQFTAIANSGPA
jgi:hypothetical protein